MNNPNPVRSVEHVDSYYASSANMSVSRPGLQAQIVTDVCVIGAGFSGLSSALHLAEKGYRVVVLEASRVGWGASGRNGGQIVNGFSRDLITIERRYGLSAAQAIGEMSLEGGEIIRQRIEKYEIQCDLRAGNVFAAFTPRQMRGLEAIKNNWPGQFGGDANGRAQRTRVGGLGTAVFRGHAGAIDRSPAARCAGQGRRLAAAGNRRLRYCDH